MKYFKIVIIFLFSLLIIDTSLCYLVDNIELYSEKEKAYLKALESFLHEKKWDILIFGSSRVYEAVHPLHIKKSLGRNAFREGAHGKNAKYNYLLYKEFKRMGHIPELVIYGMDYFVHHRGSEKEMLARFGEKYNKEKNSGKNQNRNMKPGFLSLYEKRADTAEKINNSINYIQNNITVSNETENYKKMVRLIEDTQRYLGSSSNHFNQLITVRPNNMHREIYVPHPGYEGEWFLKLLDELEKDKVRVMLIIIPDYYGTYITQTQKRAHIKEIMALTKKYGNISIHNYNAHNSGFPNKKEEFFMDGGYGTSISHLSKDGAEYFFNNYLLKDLKAIFKNKESVSEPQSR